MCFYLSNKYPKLQTAKEDIICYKEMIKEENGVRSAIFYHSKNKTIIYKFNRKYKAKDLQKDGKPIKKLIERKMPQRDGRVNAGFHSCIYKEGGNNVVCIIPKGAKYYKNDHEYVSTEIKFVRIMRRVCKIHLFNYTPLKIVGFAKI